MMNIVPEWVLTLREAGDGTSKKLRFHGRHEGWLWAPREWTKVSKDTGIGNPGKSSIDKGKKYLSKIIPKITEFLIELNRTDPEDIYIDYIKELYANFRSDDTEHITKDPIKL